jgi:hypothetical protein
MYKEMLKKHNDAIKKNDTAVVFLQIVILSQ